MSRQLDNYIRTHRKRAGLSQNEVAYLIGLSDEAKVSAHENGAKLPTLETLLAYEAAFGVPAKELFAGLYEKVEKKAKRRARALAKKLASDDPDKLSLQKLAALRACADPAATHHET